MQDPWAVQVRMRVNMGRAGLQWCRAWCRAGWRMGAGGMSNSCRAGACAAAPLSILGRSLFAQRDKNRRHGQGLAPAEAGLL